MPAQNPCVLIATPTRGSPKMQYMHSIIGTIKDLARRHIPSDFDTESGSDIAIQRSKLAMRFYERTEFTHMLMADDDMSFPEDLAARLLHANKSVVGVIASMREIDLKSAEAAVSKGRSLKEALLLAQRWFVYPPTRPSGPLIESEATGFGITLIRRDAIEAMIEKAAVRGYSLGDSKFYGFFVTRPQDASAGMPGAEDMSFYRRWRLDCGGKLWALTDVPIFHIGDFAYGGRYSDLPH
jgi:hypothetical protein